MSSPGIEVGERRAAEEAAESGGSGRGFPQVVAPLCTGRLGEEVGLRSLRGGRGRPVKRELGLVSPLKSR